MGSEQPGLQGGIAAYSRGLELHDLRGPFQLEPFYKPSTASNTTQQIRTQRIKAIFHEDGKSNIRARKTRRRDGDSPPSCQSPHRNAGVSPAAGALRPARGRARRRGPHAAPPGPRPRAPHRRPGRSKGRRRPGPPPTRQVVGPLVQDSFHRSELRSGPHPPAPPAERAGAAAEPGLGSPLLFARRRSRPAQLGSVQKRRGPRRPRRRHPPGGALRAPHARFRGRSLTAVLLPGPSHPDGRLRPSGRGATPAKRDGPQAEPAPGCAGPAGGPGAGRGGGEDRGAAPPRCLQPQEQEGGPAERALRRLPGQQRLQVLLQVGAAAVDVARPSPSSGHGSGRQRRSSSSQAPSPCMYQVPRVREGKR